MGVSVMKCDQKHFQINVARQLLHLANLVKNEGQLYGI